jgi:3-methylfumaryl-CoA hydratase
MPNETTEYEAWVGNTETQTDTITLAPALTASAVLNDGKSEFTEGDKLPPLWHWFYFLPKAPHSKVGPDGHPERGAFMPPIPLPRRMFAGARLKFVNPLVIGQPARRVARIASVSQKTGRTGTLAFVTVEYTIYQGDTLCVEEQQDIVYREAGGKAPAPTPAPWEPAPDGAWVREITPDPVLLFRFSALTFNGHRIHYDRPYAMTEEGYPGLVVHGPLTATLLIELVRANADRPVKGYSFRGQAPLFDLHPFRLVGTTDGDQVTLEAQGPDGKVAMAATADLA